MFDPSEDYERRRPKAAPPRRIQPCHWCGADSGGHADRHVPESARGYTIYACRACNAQTAPRSAESAADESGDATPTPTKDKPKKPGSVAHIPRPAKQPGRVRNYGYRSGSRAA